LTETCTPTLQDDHSPEHAYAIPRFHKAYYSFLKHKQLKCIVFTKV